MIKSERIEMNGIPALIWGEKSDKAFLFVHGKDSAKEYARPLAVAAEKKGYQTISFDLPRHGERKDSAEKLDVFDAPPELVLMADYAFSHWQSVSLFGCSIGAYFSLLSLGAYPWGQCLFQSPIVDMPVLIEKMFCWFSVTEDQLREKGEIPTPVDTLSWRYFQFANAHPILSWDFPTAILYGARDRLQDQSTIEAFAEKFHCKLTVSKNSDHPFMDPPDEAIVDRWLNQSIK